MTPRLALALLLLSFGFQTAIASERSKIQVKSSVDKSPQPSYLIFPDNYDANRDLRPLLVSLHTWSGDLEQRNKPLEAEANRRGWVYLFPNFRGRNDHPEACGSKLAQQDILDAVDYVVAKHRIDRTRIYLGGTSGGGHMTMLMVGRHPDRWAAASAWVGISDLAAWYARHAKGKYGEMMRKSCGGAPGDSKAVDRQYRDRSPLTFLHRAVNVPLEIAAGVHDGHKGSVPIRHSLDAFNVIAKQRGDSTISEDEIQQLSRPNGRLDRPRDSDRVADGSLGRAIYLRRASGPARVTIFEGGHEGLAKASAEWFAKHRLAPPAKKSSR